MIADTFGPRKEIIDQNICDLINQGYSINDIALLSQKDNKRNFMQNIYPDEKQFIKNVFYNLYSKEEILNLPEHEKKLFMNNFEEIFIYTHPEEIINRLVRDEIDDKRVLDAINQYYSNYYIASNKFIIIADPHFGKKNMNIKYSSGNIARIETKNNLKEIYDFAKSQNIRHIICAGDLIEGKCNNVYNQYYENKEDYNSFTIEKQIQSIKDFYINQFGIMTYYIYGNHDDHLRHNFLKGEHFFRHLKRELCDFTNLKYIGTGCSYIRLIDNNYLKITHQASGYLVQPELPYQLELTGHSHAYSYSEAKRKMHLPASFDNPYTQTGFILFEIKDNAYEYTFYNTNKAIEKGKILKR